MTRELYGEVVDIHGQRFWMRYVLTDGIGFGAPCAGPIEQLAEALFGWLP